MTDEAKDEAKTEASKGDEPASAEAKLDAKDATAKGDEPADPIFEALWSRVVEAWDDDKTHAAVLDHALREQRLPDLAGRYRALENDAAKGERAKKKLGAIVVAATQMLFAMKTPARAKTPPVITIATALLCLATLAYLAFLILRSR